MSATAPAQAAQSHDRCDQPARNARTAQGLEKLPTQNTVGSLGEGIDETAKPNNAPPIANAPSKTKFLLSTITFFIWQRSTA
jgi:hypothetical protein